MQLYKDLKEYVFENKYSVYSCVFLLFVSYFYFINNWSISIDSEVAIFTNGDNSLAWIKEGRILTGLFDYFFKFGSIIPFWNDFFSIFILFISSIFWGITLTKINNDKVSIFIFKIIYLISPIYCFYLRFTTYNISISIGLLFISIVFYCLISLESKTLRTKFSNMRAVFFLTCAFSIYQVFVFYYISGLIIILLYLSISAIDKKAELLKIKKYVIHGVLIFIFSLMIYRLLMFITFLFIQKSSYTDGFFNWQLDTAINTVYSITQYFKEVYLTYQFNFLVYVTIILMCIWIVSSLILRVNKILILVGVIILFCSGFTLPFALGTSMPLRTMQTIPLVLAGIWLIICACMRNNKIRYIILLLALCATLMNARYINKIFYGDNMRLNNDINFANQIYLSLVSKVGNAITYKPLVIIGQHAQLTRPFIITSQYDTIGKSFFQWDNGNNGRMNLFMKWVGDDVIAPSTEQITKAKSMSYNMPKYPSSGSIVESSQFIILKLSDISVQ